MDYQLDIAGFEGQKIVAQVSFWAGVKLLVDGTPAKKGAKRGDMLLQRSDGTQVVAHWKPQFLGLDVPQLVVDGRTIDIVAPLKWYQWIWGCWPVLLIATGGALGAIAGVIAAAINVNLFKTKMNPALKYLLTAVVSILAVVVYLVAAVIFSMLVKN
jgi:hypothetical protein